MAEGVKHDQDKPMVGLIPARSSEEEGYVWGMGAKKYGTHNWRKGLTTLRICGAILRHTYAIMKGEDIDPESGRHHGAHIRCDAAMLIEFFYEGRTELDDRYKKESKPISDGVSLYKASEEAQTKVAEMVKSNKEKIFNIQNSASTVITHTSGYASVQPKSTFVDGDVVRHVNNDVEVTVEGTYWDKNGKEVLFVKDSDNKIFGVDPNSYKSIYVKKEAK